MKSPMKSYRALIAEDEPILAATLSHTLQRLWPQLQMEPIAANGLEAVQQALSLRPDVLFLDIKMPGKSGLEAAQELAQEWPDDLPFPLVVFVTAYDEYALAAFEQAAADYVLKPINDARLSKTIERLQQRLTQLEEPATPQINSLEQLAAQLRSLLPQPAAANHSNQAEPLSMIRAAVGNQVRMIPVPQVLYFEATDKYVNVVTAEAEALIRTSLKELMPQLDSQQFWQIHRGTIVNISCVQAAIRDEAGKLSLKLRGRPEQLRVSSLYAHLFRQM
ncbi:MAG: LytTR family DNA-binding domain-containing protein [Pseudomonadota bacterium]